MTTTDKKAILIIGAGVGLLIQPILANNVNFNLSPALRFGVLIFFVLFAPFALWLAKLISKVLPSIYQFAQFAAVGTLNTFIDVGVFNLETFLYGSTAISNTTFALFKAISFLFATTNSFVWNKYWTFGSKDKAKAKEVSAFYAIAILGWVLNVGVATLTKATGPSSKIWVNLVAPLMGVAASFLWDFFGYKFFVFGKKEPPAGTANPS